MFAVLTHLTNKYNDNDKENSSLFIVSYDFTTLQFMLNNILIRR